MTENCWKHLIKAIEKEAARYKKRYKGKMRKKYGGSPDWLELTTIGIESIKQSPPMFEWCAAFSSARKAIVKQYKKWWYDKYDEPESLTIKITKGQFGLEYEEMEVTDNQKIDQILIKQCPVCGKAIEKSNRITCSNRCRQVVKYNKIRKK